MIVNSSNIEKLNELNKKINLNELSIIINSYVKQHKIKFKIYVPKQINRIIECMNSDWNLEKLLEKNYLKDKIFNLIINIDILLYKLLKYYTNEFANSINLQLNKLDNLKIKSIYSNEISIYILKSKLFIKNYFADKINLFLDIYN